MKTLKPICLSILIAALCAGCVSTVPLTPKIGIDFGVVAVRIGGVADVEFHGLSETNSVVEDGE